MHTSFTLSRRLAIGGTAELWLASTSGGEARVIKRLFAQHTPEQARRLTAERVALGRAQAPQLVRCLESGEGWLALEWVDGVDAAALAGHLGRRGSALAPAAALHLLAEACAGLAAVHAAALVHADVAPGNVLLGRDGRVKIADLGLARALDAGPRGEEGTLAYQPPEQLRREAIDASADLFALALVVYELVTGTAARPAGMLGIAELLAARAQLPRPPSAVRPGVPAALDAVLLPALDPDPARRPRSAAAWLRSIEASAAAEVPGRGAELLAQAVTAAARKAIPTAATAQDRVDPDAEVTVLLPGHGDRPAEATTVIEARAPRAAVEAAPSPRLGSTLSLEPPPNLGPPTITRTVPSARAPSRSPPRWLVPVVAALVAVVLASAAWWRARVPSDPASSGEEVPRALATSAVPEVRAVIAPAETATAGAGSTGIAPAAPALDAEVPEVAAPARDGASARPSPRAVPRTSPRSSPTPSAAASVAPRLAIGAASCPLRASGHGAEGAVPTRTAPLTEGVSMVELSSGALRLLLRVTSDAAGTRVSFGAPRGSYYTVGCGGARRTTPLLDVPLVDALACEVVTVDGMRCTYALSLDRT